MNAIDFIARSADVLSERPILFNGEMVRAILDGRKTQTRRVVSPQPRDVDGFYCVGQDTKTGKGDWITRFRGQPKATFPVGNHSVKADIQCPYGDVEGRLWVRETWAWSGFACDHEEVLWRADDEWSDEERGREKWRPSIHMPRWASRITLEVTDVRVERVQDISEEDARSEGCPFEGKDKQFPVKKALPGERHIEDGWDCCRDWFADLWNQINAKRGFGWDVNPWVWVIEFMRITDAVESVPTEGGAS